MFNSSRSFLLKTFNIKHKISTFLKVRRHRKRIVCLLMSQYDASNLISCLQLKNKNRMLHSVFEDEQAEYDFYTNKQLLLISQKKTNFNSAWQSELFVRLNKFSKNKKPINLFLVLNVKFFNNQHNYVYDQVFSHFDLIASKINRLLNIYIIVICPESLIGVVEFKKYALNCSLSSNRSFNLTVKNDGSIDQLRTKFNQTYEEMLIKVSTASLLMHSQVDEKDRDAILFLPSLLTALKAKTDAFLTRFISTSPVKTIKLKSISLVDSNSDSFNQIEIKESIDFKRWPTTLYKAGCWIKRKKKLFIHWIVFFMTLTLFFMFIRSYFHIRNIGYIINSRVKSEITPSIQKQSFSFLEFIDRLNALPLLLNINFLYVSFKLKHAIEQVKKTYIQHILLNKIKELIEQSLNNKQLSVGERYIWFSAYLAIGSANAPQLLKKLLVFHMPAHKKKLRRLENVLWSWHNYHLPSILLNRRLVKKNRFFFSKISIFQLFFSLLESYFNEKELYTIPFYRSIFQGTLNDRVKFIVSSLAIKLKDSRIGQSKMEQWKACIRDEYVKLYFQYWLTELNRFELPSINSISSGISVLKDLAKNNSTIEQKLDAFYQNVHPLLPRHKYMPGSISIMDLWITDPKNIKLFKLKLLWVKSELEKNLKKSNRHEIFLKISKDYIQGKNTDNLMRVLLELHESAPPLLQTTVKIFEAKLIQLIIGQAIDEIYRQWRIQVLPFYQKNIESYYPIHPLGQDIPIDLFFKFFGQGGILLSFFNENIKPFLYSSAQAELAKPFQKEFKDLNPLLTQLLQISKKFSTQKKNMKFNFLIQPVLMSQGYTKVRLMIDSMNIDYAYGPSRNFLYQWPNSADSKKIVFTCKDFSNNANTKIINGPWAFFRLLEKNHVNLNKNNLYYFIKIHIGNCRLMLKMIIPKY